MDERQTPDWIEKALEEAHREYANAGDIMGGSVEAAIKAFVRALPHGWAKVNTQIGVVEFPIIYDEPKPLQQLRKWAEE